MTPNQQLITSMREEFCSAAGHGDGIFKAFGMPVALAAPEEGRIEEVIFFMVGHNSTHGFFLGVDSADQLYRTSLDLSDDDARALTAFLMSLKGTSARGAKL